MKVYVPTDYRCAECHCLLSFVRSGEHVRWWHEFNPECPQYNESFAVIEKILEK